MSKLVQNIQKNVLLYTILVGLILFITTIVHFVRNTSKDLAIGKSVYMLCGTEGIQDLRCLFQAYPGIITDVDIDRENRVWLVIRGKEKVLYDDGRAAIFREGYDDYTVKESMQQCYPLEPYRPIPDSSSNPGRFRSGDFLATVYGREQGIVFNNLEQVVLFGKKIKFSSIGGAVNALSHVFCNLEKLAEKNSDFIRYIMPLVGKTFCWRNIYATQIKSPHSYGIAIDLNDTLGPYWGENITSMEEYLRIQKEYPTEIVQAFEDHGFIWGGKWHKFDFMHFEYRPELICKARGCSEDMGSYDKYLYKLK